MDNEVLNYYRLEAGSSSVSASTTYTNFNPCSDAIARSITSNAGCGLPIGSRTRTNIPGENSRIPLAGIGLSITPRTVMLPVPELTRLLTKLITPLSGKLSSPPKLMKIITAHLAVDGRRDAAESQVQLVDLEARLRGLHRGSGFFFRRLIPIEVLLTDGPWSFCQLICPQIVVNTPC